MTFDDVKEYSGILPDLAGFTTATGLRISPRRSWPRSRSRRLRVLLDQQYLAKNPFGYRCHANTGVPFPNLA